MKPHTGRQKGDCPSGEDQLQEDVDTRLGCLQEELMLQSSEIRSLRDELAKARVKERELEDARRAMLYMLEDLNESAADIERAKKEWEATFDTIKDPMFIHDKEFRIVRANKSYMKLAGLSEAEVTGRPYYSIFPKMGGPSMSCLNLVRTRLEEGNRDAWEEVTISDKLYKMRYFPVLDPAGNYIFSVHILEDITERKHLEDQLRQSQKLEAIGQLAGGIAHDFNNILQAIIGYGHLTLMRMKDDEPSRHNIDQIMEAAQRATALTQSLLAFSRKSAVNLRGVDLNEVIRNFEKFLVRLVREDIELRTLCSREELPIMADKGQIEQVIMNLATNARDAMPPGGRLTIETKRVKLDAAFSRVNGYGASGEYACVIVADTGLGMDESTTEKIFEPFFTTKEPGKGSGLGLAVVYGIIKNHNGFIDVSSEVGKGTVFKIYFPIVTAIARVKETDTADTFHIKGGTETILLAEDDAALRRLIAAVLSGYGYSVIEAVDGGDAIYKFIENKDRIQLAILDGIMPKKNGREVYAGIVKLKPDVKVIFVSGYSEDFLGREGIAGENSIFLPKPILPSDLLMMIRKVMDGEMKGEAHKGRGAAETGIGADRSGPEV